MGIWVDGVEQGGGGGGFANPMTSAGDMIVGGVAGAAGRLGIGTGGYVLRAVAGNPAWREISSAGTLLARPTAAAVREGQTYWITNAAAGLELCLCVHKGGATYAWEKLAYGVTATGAAVVQAANAAAARTALAFPALSTPLYVLRMNAAGTAMEFAASGDAMITDHSWNRPAPTAVAAGATFLSIDDLTVQVSTGVAAAANVDASGWVQDLPTGLGPDRCGLTPGTISAQFLDLSSYTIDHLTLVALIKPSGALTSGAFGCIGALGDTTIGSRGLTLFLKENSGNIDIVAFGGFGSIATTIVASAFSAASTALHAVAVAAVAGNFWRVSVDGGATADVAMGAVYVAPTTTDSIGFGSRFNSTNPFLGQVLDMMVWDGPQPVSSADMALLTTLPATPTYALPESASTGAATIRVQASRWDQGFPTTLRARGLPGGVALVCANVAKVSF